MVARVLIFNLEFCDLGITAIFQIKTIFLIKGVILA